MNTTSLNVLGFWRTFTSLESRPFCLRLVYLNLYYFSSTGFHTVDWHRDGTVRKHCSGTMSTRAFNQFILFYSFAILITFGVWWSSHMCKVRPEASNRWADVHWWKRLKNEIICTCYLVHLCPSRSICLLTVSVLQQAAVDDQMSYLLNTQEKKYGQLMLLWEVGAVQACECIGGLWS